MFTLALHECSKEEEDKCANQSVCSVQGNDLQCQCLKGYRKVEEQCIGKIV